MFQWLGQEVSAVGDQLQKLRKNLPQPAPREAKQQLYSNQVILILNFYIVFRRFNGDEVRWGDKLRNINVPKK